MPEPHPRTRRTLVVTNDLPPRQGGIEVFVDGLLRRFPADGAVVYTSAEPGARTAAYDAQLPHVVVRDAARTLLPTRGTAERAVALARRFRCDTVWFGAAAPLGLLAGALRRDAGVRRVVATTHGHEVWWARTPGARSLLHRIGAGADVVTHLGERTRRAVAPVLPPTTRLERLVPGVDTDLFRPGLDPRPMRARHGIGPRTPLILCAARLVPRKGQDTLIEALPMVRRAVPGARLLLVGAGPDERRLRRIAAREGVPDAVVLAGGRPHAELPGYYAAADVFAMPCRTRRAGLEVEGLGIVFLEAAAAGLPVVAGKSGGAPDTVCEGETGYVVDGRSPAAVADRLVRLLRDRELARGMAGKGRDRVVREWSWERSYETLADLLGR
ncbi:glycosyltransferase [Streptomyces sp. SID5785]|uniref:glycosyltransferase family 4 protein n=1 Tax=Streptomyces sp. SID5785 TaxID=2690309 RepID=UPI0013612A41|nr:glycosyltransferase family 4 protein [Streptomyces sp. SID5785]MZD05703.1 glycosyltransferase [Streptomyces sp. SID5785]